MMETAQLYKARYNPYIFGRAVCGRVGKMGKAGLALVKDDLHTVPGAAAVVGKRSTSGTRTDFRGATYTLRAGALTITNIVAENSTALRALLDSIENTHGIAGVDLFGIRQTIYAETIPEAIPGANFRQTFTDAGYSLIGHQVKTSSEVVAVWCKPVALHRPPTYLLPDPNRDAEWHTLTLLDADFLDADTLASIEERLCGVRQRFVQHYSHYNLRKSWTAVALRGYTDDPGFVEKPAEMSRHWKAANPTLISNACRDTTLMREFPEVVALLEDLPCDAERVRFMALAPEKGELARHADITNKDAGVADGKLARLHIPIVTNDKARFCGWNLHGERLAATYRAGNLFYLDQRKPHAATNKGAQPRIHLVIDAIANADLRRMIERGKPAKQDNAN